MRRTSAAPAQMGQRSGAVDVVAWRGITGSPDLRIERRQECTELHGARVSPQLPEHLAGLRFQGGDERGGAMPFVIQPDDVA